MAAFVFIFIGYPDFRREIEVITLYLADSIFSLKPQRLFLSLSGVPPLFFPNRRQHF